MIHVRQTIDRIAAWLGAIGGRRPPPNVLIRDVVTVTTYDMDAVRRYIPEWDNLTRVEKLEALDEYGPPPKRQTTSSNTTINDLHEYLVDHLDTNQSVSAIDASHLALGDDGTAASASDTGLTNEVYREAVDTTTDATRDLETETLLDENEGNGNTFREVGLVSASTGGTFFNHSVIADEKKVQGDTKTFKVVLEFRPA